MAEDTGDGKANVIMPGNAMKCEGPICPLCTPFGLATFLIGFMVILYTPWPYQLLGWLTLGLGYMSSFARYLRGL